MKDLQECLAYGCGNKVLGKNIYCLKCFSPSGSEMKIKLTVRRRTKIDGISGIATVVKILCDINIAGSEIQTELSIPEEKYDLFVPGSQWETELEKING